MANRHRKIFNEGSPIEQAVVKEEPSIKEVKEEPIIEEVEEPKEVTGVIDGVDSCLNIRREPEVKANNQIAILGKGTKIVIFDPDKIIKNKDGEWFKVKLTSKDENGNPVIEHGYAMKKYIKII